MKAVLSIALATACGIAAGFWMTRAGTSTSARAQVVPSASAGHERQDSHQRAVVAERHDLTTLRRQLARDGGRDPEITGQLERMTPAAIRSLMLEVYPMLRNASDLGNIVMETLRAAARELESREGEGALQWADSLDPKAGKETILRNLVAATAEHSPDAIKPWLDKLKADAGDNNPMVFIHVFSAASKAAASRSAEELVKLKEAYGNEFVAGVPSEPLPADFNFPLLLDHFSNGQPISRVAMQQWMMRDPEAAWKYIKGMNLSEQESKYGLAGYVNSYLAVRAVGGQEKEAIAEVLGRVRVLEPESRNLALQHLLDDGMAPAAASLLPALANDEERIQAVQEQLNLNGDVGSAVTMLKLVGSQESQAKALQGMLGKWGRYLKGDTEFSRKGNEFLTTAMDELQLSPALREQIAGSIPK